MSTSRTLLNFVQSTVPKCTKKYLFRELLPFTKSTGFTHAKHFSFQSKILPKPASMRFIQFKRGSDGQTRLGSLSEDGMTFIDLSDQKGIATNMIDLIKSPNLAAEMDAISKSCKWERLTTDIQLLAPLSNPEKIICIGLNYLGHCIEQNKEAPKEPMFFSKFASAITGPTGNVILHEITNQLDWEVELAVVIGKEARHVKKADAFDYVFGYSVAQDISARDWQKLRNGGQFLIGKSMDSFCPLGPAIVHKNHVTDPHQLKITCTINNIQKQSGNTNELIFKIDDIIHLLSKCITLKPGDIILTGTPAGVGMHRRPAEFLSVGDVIDSEIESIGKLRNLVIADSP